MLLVSSFLIFPRNGAKYVGTKRLNRTLSRFERLVLDTFLNGTMTRLNGPHSRPSGSFHATSGQGVASRRFLALGASGVFD